MIGMQTIYQPSQLKFSRIHSVFDNIKVEWKIVG